MIYYIANLLLIIFEVFCCKIFFESFGSKRSMNKRYIDFLQLTMLCYFGDLISRVLENHLVLKQMANFVVISLIMFWYMKISYKKSLIIAFLYISIMLTADYISYALNWRLFGEEGAASENRVLEGYLVSLLGKVILFLFVLIIKKQFSKKKTEMLADAEWLKFFFSHLYNSNDCCYAFLFQICGNTRAGESVDYYSYRYGWYEYSGILPNK